MSTLKTVYKIAKIHLKKHRRKTGSNHTVIFDFDGTLINNDQKPVKYICKMAKLAKKLRYHVVVLTARPNDKENKSLTQKQLHECNVYPDELIMRNKGDNVESFKVRKRQTLSNIAYERNAHSILSVGDNWFDMCDDKKHYILSHDIYSFQITNKHGIEHLGIKLPKLK